ncbi:FecR family protein [Tamlana sp. 2201CG12-4]|uniref:FecR family protein n=1 Tax=Tamlana sp. 2201CG12-4 TaxID=3112582 RepID=UPI002DB721E0|nr:FecR family protein [Tamlana sp. 2201CG12-4]MEC3908667.1 FecR family protein [Tamlana sp. 2201CG12-4]
MKEKKFRKLLKKSIEGSLNDEESKILEKFNADLKSRNKEPYFINEAHKHQLKESIWKGVTANKVSSRKTQLFKQIASVAAVCVGLIAIGFLLLKDLAFSNQNTLPANAITLQLEDGSIKVIEENKTTTILDNDGNIIGNQNNNELVYSPTGAVKKLKYNTLTIPHGKTFELHLSDGTIAHLNAGSSLKYPIQFLKGQDRKIFVTGEVFLDVAKDQKHPFIVNADNLNIRVLGTKFNVNAYPEDNISEVVLVEGSVSLYTDKVTYNPDDASLLEPGFKARFNKKNESLVKEEVITDIYTSWINGELVFRDMPFENILKKLERHYDVTIINKNEKLSKEKFNANFGKITVERVFENLRKYHGINYKIKGNIITVE